MLQGLTGAVRVQVLEPTARTTARTMARGIAHSGATAATLALRGLVRGYQLFIAPLLGHNCRYLPSCSAYAMEALERHGPARGSWLATKRICRCHPWGGHGLDPVPAPEADSRHAMPAQPGATSKG